MPSDPWSVLGVGPGATREEIRVAYRRLALKHHPDRDHNPGAAERMRDINVAYRTLMTAEPAAVPSAGRSTVDAWYTGATGNTATWSWTTYRSLPEDCLACGHIITFGKHRGYPLFWIAQSDAQYLGWIARQFDAAQADIINSAQVALQHATDRVHQHRSYVPRQQL